MEILEFKNIAFKNLAFKILHTEERNKKGFEDVINDSLSINNDSLEIGDIIEREYVGVARDNIAVKMLTIDIIQTFKKCKNDFDYYEKMKPRRELTEPSEGVYNEGRDNIENNLIMCVQDEIHSPNYHYTIIDLIGQGISGQVFKCKRKENDNLYAIKIIKNKKAYKNQALIELKILEFLNNEVDKQDLHHIIRIYDHFYYKEHLCIVFELLNENLFELLKQNYFQGVSLNSIRFIIKQILEAVYQFQKVNLIHCDLKPENVLLKIDKDNQKNDIIIKITDFGSSCFKNHTIFQYIQSRYYRAPEVLMGCDYSCEIDIWSTGCIAAELFLGEPLLPGSCEYDQLRKIEKLFGDIPNYMLREGRNSRKYYVIDPMTKYCRLKTIEEYFKDYPNDLEPKYEIPLNLQSLDELAVKGNKKNTNLNNSNHDVNNELDSFVNFLKGLLTIDPKYRWNAKQALRHPFITKEKFDGYFNPNYEEISQLYLNSVEGSYFSDYGQQGFNNRKFFSNQKQRINNPNMHHSMIVNVNPYMSNNISLNNSMYSNNNNNSSMNMSCYQPNINNIPLRLLKNFPYARLDEINLKPETEGHKKKINYYNKYDGNMNKTYMKTSFDGTYFDNSFTNDKNIHGLKHRQIKDNLNQDINKFSKLANRNINNQNGILNNKLHNNSFAKGKQNKNVMFCDDVLKKMYSTEQGNRSLFYKNKSSKIHSNYQDYESLINKTNLNNRSFDCHNRERSNSDYNETNLKSEKLLGTPKYNHVNNNLNLSNCSTHRNEGESLHKNLFSLEVTLNSKTRSANYNSYLDKLRCNINIETEIKEEDQGVEELLNK